MIRDAAGELHHHGPRQGASPDKRILWRHALQPSSLTAAHRRRPQLRHAHRRRGGGRGDLPDPRHRHAHLPGDQRAADRGAAELHTRSSPSAYVLINFAIGRAVRGARPRSVVPEPEYPETPAGGSMKDDPMRGSRRRGRPRHVARSTPAPSTIGRGRDRARGPPPQEAAQGLRGRRRGCSIAWLGARRRSRSRSWRRALPIDDPRAITTDIARRGPLADAGAARPVTFLGGDFNSRDVLSPAHLGRSHHAGRSRRSR